MFRLSPITFIICGAVLIAITWGGFWFFSIDKTRKEVAYWKEQNELLDDITSRESQDDARERVKLAYEMVQAAEVQWKEIAEKRTPSVGRFNLSGNRWQATVEARRWHGEVERDLKRWIAGSGVTLTGPVEDGQLGPFVPYPTELPNELVEFYFNFPALEFPVAIWDLGTLTVEGTWEQITNHVRSWSDIPGYVASVRGLAITGTGRRLEATYGLVVIAYINTPEVFGGPDDDGKIPDVSPAQSAGGRSGTQNRPGGGGPSVGGGAGGGRAAGGAGAAS
ncbi:MAG: hypothetical protein IH851_08830 [Armatimonadetes bacterium]|nr:hypothetical protein [Armatimonadota bacterium]